MDTRDKRASAVGVDLPTLTIYPNPDGAVSGADRQQVAYKYRGIIASPPFGVSVLAFERGVYRRVLSRIFGRIN